MAGQVVRNVLRTTLNYIILVHFLAQEVLGWAQNQQLLPRISGTSKLNMPQAVGGLQHCLSVIFIFL